MKVVVALDSFKGSVSSLEAGNAVKAGILKAVPGAEVAVLPLADGGEGTTDAVSGGLGGTLLPLEVTGPLGKKVSARYGIVPEKKLCVMEMSEAAGLTLVPDSERNPLNTTSRGVGEMILDALENGYRDFLIGIGGSATNDGGIGMLAALGCVFKDADGKPLFGYGQDVERIASIDTATLDPRIKESRIRVACDVTNPLCGKNGASFVYGPQKGATEEIAARLDAALGAFAKKTAFLTKTDFTEMPGAGAAGGLGFALASYLDATLSGGVGLVLDAINFKTAAENADFVVTGEGRLDGQTAMGKAPVGVAALSKKTSPKCTVIALCGSVDGSATKCNGHGIDAFFPILQRPATLQEAMAKPTAVGNLSRTAEQVFRLVGALRAPSHS